MSGQYEELCASEGRAKFLHDLVVERIVQEFLDDVDYLCLGTILPLNQLWSP